MKKSLLSILFVTCFCFAAIAQTYTFSNSSSTYSALVGPTSINNNTIWDSNLWVEIPIGFTLNVFNQSFDSVSVSGGNVVFGNSATDIVMQPWGGLRDLDTVNSSSPVSYELSGVAGTRILKIEWYNAGLSGDSTYTEYLDVQIWFYEGSNIVEMHVGDNTVTTASLWGDPGPYIGGYDDYFDEYNLAVGSVGSYNLSMALVGLGDIPASGEVFTFDPIGHCSNGTMDGDETGVDCGGAGCVACHCANGSMDADETDIDCGGVDCEACPVPPGCPYDNSIYLTYAAPTNVGDSVFNNCIYASEHDAVTGFVAGNTYRISTCATATPFYDTQLSIYTAGGGSLVAENDDYCVLASEITFTPAVSGDYDILVDLYPCTYDSVCITLVIELVAISGGSCDPVPVEICILSIDSSDNKVVVVWEKLSYPVVGGSYNIYRETSEAGKYAVIGNVPYASLSTFKDPDAKPETRAYKYKITSVNSCGIESPLSAMHRTLKLSIGLGIGGSFNLTWANYEGISFTSYDLWRYTTTGASVIDGFPDDVNLYTDPSPPGNTIMYQLEMITSLTCTADKGKSYNSSKSNTTSTGGSASLGVTTTSTAATGPCDGTATAVAAGGTAPYTYSWNTVPEQATATATGLCGGSTYTVSVFDAAGDNSSSAEFISGPVSIVEVSLSDFFDVYPNPNRGSFDVNLNLEGDDFWTLKIFSLLGSEVYSEDIGEVNGNIIKSIDLQDQVEGIYYVKLSCERATWRKKVIIY